MACERVDISVLVVDDDDTSLAIVANTLISWEFKVLTANGARNALETLREFEGFFDLVITELHMSGMSGFEFQKRVQDEFQLPVILMSADTRKSVMSKSLENGAALYILKPFCADDFKNIWEYAMAARKGKLVENEHLRSGEGESQGEKIFFQEVKSSTTSSSTEPKGKRKNRKRKSQKEDQSEGRRRVIKKPKMVWTTCLHNAFLHAIKQIGLGKAVPKKILEIMNIPNLTRENVASHLQKYRIFLKKIAGRGIIEGLSQRTLKSRFASGLPASVIQDIKTRSENLRLPVKQYLKILSYQTGKVATAHALKPFNKGPLSFLDHQVSSNTCVTPQLGGGQFPYPNPLHNGLVLENQHGDSLNQVKLGLASFGSNIGVNNIHQNMLGSYENAGVHGLMTSANVLTGGLKYGDHVYQNYGSLGNHNISHDQGNWNMGSWSSSNLPQTNYTYYNSSSGIQLNDGSKMVGSGIEGGFNCVGMIATTATNNSFGFINGNQNANMNVSPLGHGNLSLVQGRFAFASNNAGDGCASELQTSLITDGTREENVSWISQLPQELDDYVVEKEHHYNNANSISEGEISQLENDLSELFFMLDDINFLNETEENSNASEFLNSDFSSSCHVVQALEQHNGPGEVIVPPAKSTLNLPNESPTNSDKNSNQLLGDDGFADRDEPFDRFWVNNVSSDSGMEFIEALFGTEAN